jgi:protein-S-isoprenylcysteine O-methyltransferase Ste14
MVQLQRDDRREMSDLATKRPDRWLVRCGNFLFHRRNTLFPVVLLALFIGFRPQYPRGSERLDYLLDAAGILVAFTGQALRIAVIGYAYIIRGGRNQRVYAEDLVTGGFFAHSRNPLYLGNVLVLVGLFLIYNNPWVYALGIGFCAFAYVAIVAAEEAYLREKFGDAYAAYARNVPRWIPRLEGFRESVRGMRFNWRRVLLKEYGSTFAWSAGAIAIMVGETLRYHAYAERSERLTVMWLALGALTVGWATTRYLKLSRRLTADPPPTASAAATARVLGTETAE